MLSLDHGTRDPGVRTENFLSCGVWDVERQRRLEAARISREDLRREVIPLATLFRFA